MPAFGWICSLCGIVLGTTLWFQASAHTLDFELPQVEGGSFLRLSELPPRMTLVNFWRADCPPCVAELPLFIEMARREGFRLVTVALQTPSETRDFWPRVPGDPASHLALHGPSEPRGLLRRFGNSSGIIPYTILLHRNGWICAKQSGKAGINWIMDNLSKCDKSGIR